MWRYWTLYLRLLLVGVILPGSAGVLLLTYSYFASRTAALVSRGDVVRAPVHSLQPEGESVLVRFGYPDGRGNLHYGEEHLSPTDASDVQVAGFVEVRYDPYDPDRYILAGIHASSGLDRVNRRSSLYAGAALLLLAVTIFSRRTFIFFRITRLIRRGVPTVSSVRSHVSRGLNQPPARFSYTYQGANGRWREGYSPKLPRPLLARFPVGRTLCVVVDPSNHRKSAPDIFGLRRS